MPLSSSARVALGIGAAIATPVVVVSLTIAVAVGLTALPDDAAFRVGDTVVTTAQLDDRLEVLDALYGIAAPSDPARREEFRRASAKTVALSMALDQAAAEERIGVADAEVGAAFDRFVAERFPDGRQGMVRLLATVGASEQDVRDEIRRQLVAKRLFDATVGQHVGDEVTDAEVQAFYDGNSEKFTQPETRRITNIVVGDRGVAEQVVERARSGTDFAELVREYSLDPSTRDTGGDLGFLASAQLEETYAAAAFAAAPGGLFGPVQTSGGWNIGHVGEVRPARLLTFEEVRDQARAALTSQREVDAWRRWVDEQIRAIGITYADAYQPESPSVLPPSAAGAEGMPSGR